MNSTLKVIVTLPAILFLFMGGRILFDPEGALGELGMPLLDGLGRSTQIGDLGAFFVTSAILILLGVFNGKREWLYAPALLLGLTALFRLWATVGHDATLAVQQIAVEVIVAVLLLFAASRIKPAK
jgi:hypothetical protein